MYSSSPPLQLPPSIPLPPASSSAPSSSSSPSPPTPPSDNLPETQHPNTTTATTTTTPHKDSSQPCTNTLLDDSTDDIHSRMSASEQVDSVREKDEYIAILEYELRQAKETVEKLKSRLTSFVKAPDDLTAPVLFSATPSISAPSSANLCGLPENEPILPYEDLNLTLSCTPMLSESTGTRGSALPACVGGKKAMQAHEIRALGYLVAEWLKDAGFKMTTITFSDENDDQDLDDWDDVGLHMQVPPSLVELYRMYVSGVPPSTSTAFSTSMSSAHGPTLRQKFEASFGKDHNWEQNADIDGTCLTPELSSSLPSATGNIGSRHGQVVIGLATPQLSDCHSANEPIPTAATQKNEPSARRSTISEPINSASSRTVVPQLPVLKLLRALPKATLESRLDNEVSSISSSQSAVITFGNCLPHIIPNVLLNKREELIPVCLVVIKEHPDSQVRDNLIHMLFNLIKKPDEKQRRMIVLGCVALAQTVPMERIEEELLPECWENIGNKFAERRSLVAEACGNLAPYVKVDLCSSLLLPILKQLLDDTSYVVREAVCRNLALLLRLLNDREHLNQARDMMFRLLKDASPSVVQLTYKSLLPVFGEHTSALDNDYLLTEVMSSIFSDVDRIFAAMSSSPNLKDSTALMNSTDYEELERLFRVMENLAHHVFSCVLAFAPCEYSEDSGDPPKPPPFKGDSSVSPDASDKQSESSQFDPPTNQVASAVPRSLSKEAGLQISSPVTPNVVVTAVKEDATPEEKQRAVRRSACLNRYLRFWKPLETEKREEDVTDLPRWEKLEWIDTVCIPFILRSIESLDSANTILVSRLASFLHALGSAFGRDFASRCLKPPFDRIFATASPPCFSSERNVSRESQSILPNVDGEAENAAPKHISIPVFSTELKPSLLSKATSNSSLSVKDVAYLEGDSHATTIRARALPYYVLGVLSLVTEILPLMNFLKQICIEVCICENGWEEEHFGVLKFTVAELCQNNKIYVDPFHTLLCQLVLHHHPRVRAGTIPLFDTLSHALSVNSISRKVVPAMINLGNDSNRYVRRASICGLGSLVQHVTKQEILEKIMVQMESFFDDPLPEMRIEVARTFGKIVGHTEIGFRDGFILPGLAKLTALSLTIEDMHQKKALMVTLVDAYRTSLGCFLTHDNITMHILPGLYSLKAELLSLEASLPTTTTTNTTTTTTPSILSRRRAQSDAGAISGAEPPQTAVRDGFGSGKEGEIGIQLPGSSIMFSTMLPTVSSSNSLASLIDMTVDYMEIVESMIQQCENAIKSWSASDEVSLYSTPSANETILSLNGVPPVSNSLPKALPISSPSSFFSPRNLFKFGKK